MIACAVILCGTAHSLPFAFQIAQYDKTRTEISESSFTFEDVMLDYFFNAGYIVSNLPSTTTDDPKGIPFDDAAGAARDGYLDYLAMIVLVYDKDPPRTASAAPNFAFSYAAWRLYRVSDGRMISSGRTATKDAAGSDAETALKNCAWNVSRDVDSALKKN
jgi:hypothetical protein